MVSKEGDFLIFTEAEQKLDLLESSPTAAADIIITELLRRSARNQKYYEQYRDSDGNLIDDIVANIAYHTARSERQLAVEIGDLIADQVVDEAEVLLRGE